MLSKNSTKLFSFVVPIISTLLTVLVIEVGFNLFHPIPFSIERSMYFEPNQYTGYKLKPNSTGYFRNEITAQANKHGHRDDFVPLKKPDGVFRILLLGDSFTVGANVRQSQTYAAILEKSLNDNSATPIEVINTGVGGWEPFHYAEYYEHYGRQFSPDLVLIGLFVGNDAYNQINDFDQTRTAVLGRRVSQKSKKSPFIHAKIFLYKYSNIVRLALNKGPVQRNPLRKNCSDFNEQFIEIQRYRLNNHLIRSVDQENKVKNSIYQITRVKELVDKDSIPLRVILIPDENQLNIKLQQAIVSSENFSKYDFDMPQTMLLEMFNYKGISVTDLLPFFRDDSRCLYMNDTHWTPKGHTLAATIIQNDIIRDKTSLNLSNISLGRTK